MYNKKSKVSAILTIVAAVLVLGLMILLPLLQPKVEGDNEVGAGIGAVFALLFFILGCLPLYASALPFAIVGLVFGCKMLKEQARQKLISLNKRMLIATCVLLPVLFVGLLLSGALIANSSLGLLPVIYTVVTAISYFAALVCQIVAIVLLKKSPEEEVLQQ